MTREAYRIKYRVFVRLLFDRHWYGRLRDMIW